MTARVLGGAVALLVLGAVTSAFTTSATAQSGGEPAKSGMICMAGKPNDPKAGQTFVFYVPEARAAELEARGYSTTSCNSARESFAEYKVNTCQLARTAPLPVRQSLEKVYGISLDELCKLAMEIAV
jgi:hypothetical protein